MISFIKFQVQGESVRAKTAAELLVSVLGCLMCPPAILALEDIAFFQ